ncbi:hypothetical protein SK128_026978 [Halocaridina rubra]|uniref:Sulfatase N-terminal domain-containing protein n=1 Tax=Halocaridina rubra TaxID=373956 RepID=A0AAN9AEL4_HALRR
MLKFSHSEDLIHLTVPSMIQSRTKLCCWLILTIWLVIASLSKSLPSQNEDPKPHIILIVADDLGWNDVSWHNPEVKNPNMEALANTGIILSQSYVQPICTPTRSALLTGRYPHALGRQHDVLWPEEPTGLTIERQLLPEALKMVGYSTHVVGKWHVGFCSWDYTPTSRGFDSFYGHYTGGQDYYTHTRPTWNPGRTHWKHDDNYPKYVDINDTRIKYGYDFRNNTEPDYEVDGTYSTYLFSSYVENLLESRNKSEPLFLYLPFQSVHSPLQVPENYTEPFAHIQDEDRRIKLGMILAMDEAIGRVVDSLKTSEHYNNSIIVFTTDNGGPTISAGNNWPLRGNKTTLWEGGTRGAAFIHSPLLPQHGFISNKLIHITDWFSTFASLGGAMAPSDTDGYDQWEAITTSAPSPRKEMIYNIDITDEINAGVRYGDYKLLVGDPGPGDWTPPPEGVRSDVKHNSEGSENDIINAADTSIKYIDSKMLQEKNKFKTSNQKSFIRAKRAKTGPFIMNAQLDSEETEQVEDDTYIIRDSYLDMDTNYKWNEMRKQIDDEKQEDLDSSEESILEDTKETYEDVKRESVSLQDLAIHFDKYKNLRYLITNTTVVRLYNVRDDPEEREDLSEENPDMVETLLGILSRHMGDYVEPDILPNDPSGNPIYWNNTWTPGWCTAK